MARDSIDILELLRKRGMDGDVDFLREAVAVLANGIMDSEASVKARAGHVLLVKPAPRPSMATATCWSL